MKVSKDRNYIVYIRECMYNCQPVDLQLTLYPSLPPTVRTLIHPCIEFIHLGHWVEVMSC